jgi:phage-related protein
VIYNGIDSRSLPGLIIQELPTIVKAQKRVNTIEIDGRDGDITEFLGYSSYEKVLKIGLAGNYDLDLISKYFSGSGEIIFSSEPDKIYKIQILSEINFERLLKFKQADITLHTEPFKYLSGESPVILDITDETSVTVNNQGLEKSRPIITRTGSGNLEFGLGSLAVFAINISDEYVTVNSELEECYKDNLSNLRNRDMAGDFPILDPGVNIFSWSVTGTLTRIEIYPKSRWL